MENKDQKSVNEETDTSLPDVVISKDNLESADLRLAREDHAYAVGFAEGLRLATAEEQSRIHLMGDGLHFDDYSEDYKNRLAAVERQRAEALRAMRQESESSEASYTPDDTPASSVPHDPKSSESSSIPLPAERPQLVHTARQMFETRLAKYNDPHNLEWDFDDVTDKWERRAFSAFMDLVATEARLAEAQQQLNQLQIVNKQLSEGLSVRDAQYQTLRAQLTGSDRFVAGVEAAAKCAESFISVKYEKFTELRGEDWLIANVANGIRSELLPAGYQALQQEKEN